MWPLNLLTPSPLTKVFGVTTLVLVTLLATALFSLRSAVERVGGIRTQLLAEKLTSERVGAELRASERAIEVLKLENAKNEALLSRNEGARADLEKRVTRLTSKLDQLGERPYVPPTQLCPADGHTPTLDDLLDARLPVELVEWLRLALQDPRAGGAAGAGNAAGAAAAPLPLTGVQR